MERKATRICWNKNQWVSPSGPEGKSVDKNSYEVDPGYGHEEWLLDLDKTISGYKYSFLQGVNTPKKSHQGKVFRISLYTVNNGKKLCIGHINEVECVTREQAQAAVEKFKLHGWFGEMAEQLEEIGLDTSNVIEKDPLLNFNIRFKPDSLVIYESPKDVTDVYASPRYKLFDEISVISEEKFVDDVCRVVDSSLSSTEKRQLIDARIGQGLFRDRVAKVWGGEYCAVTLINIREMLVASHIVPWRSCKDSRQRLDGANGLLLCAHIDKLFDQHLLSFEKKNRRFLLRISRKLDTKILSALSIYDGSELDTHRLGLDTLSRFEMHMKEHFSLFKDKESL